MTLENKEFLRQLREEKGLSQKEVAERLGISRPSYVAVEHGKRELSLLEAEKIASLFGITLDELTRSAVPKYEKYKQMIIAFLCASAFSGKQLPKTKLAKLLYLADFAWFYDNLSSMSGLQYRRIQFGPVPDLYFRAIDELEEEGKISVERKDEKILISCGRAAGGLLLDELKEGELSLLEKIAEKWKTARTQEIVGFTHNQLPYKLCRPNEIIPYELITQEDPGHVF